MRYVLCVIVAAICIANWMPIQAINRESEIRMNRDRATAEQVSTLPEVESSARLLELYH